MFGIGFDIYSLYSQQEALNALVVNDGNCDELKWDGDENVFRINTTLLDCGMTYSTVTEGTDSYWAFKHKITKPSKMLNGAGFLTRAISVNLICTYPTVNQVSSAGLTVSEPPPAVPEDTLIELVTTIQTAFLPDEDLLNPGKPLYIEAVIKVIDDLQDSWDNHLDVSEDVRPVKIQVVAFLLNDDGTETMIEIDIPLRRRRESHIVIPGCDDHSEVNEPVNRVRVVVKFIFLNKTGKIAPVTEELSQYKKAILDALTIIKPDTCSFVHQSEETSVDSMEVEIVEKEPIPAFGDFSSQGSLQGSLSLKYYTGPTYNTIFSMPYAFLGFTMFVQVSWNVHEMKDKMAFFLKECKIVALNEKEEPTGSMKIIDEGCYAQVIEGAPLGATLLSKIGYPNSRFKYRSFSFSVRQTSYQVLQCQVQFCMLQAQGFR